MQITHTMEYPVLHLSGEILPGRPENSSLFEFQILFNAIRHSLQNMTTPPAHRFERTEQFDGSLLQRELFIRNETFDQKVVTDTQSVAINDTCPEDC